LSSCNSLTRNESTSSDSLSWLRPKQKGQSVLSRIRFNNEIRKESIRRKANRKSKHSSSVSHASSSKAVNFTKKTNDFSSTSPKISKVAKPNDPQKENQTTLKKYFSPVSSDASPKQKVGDRTAPSRRRESTRTRSFTSDSQAFELPEPRLKKKKRQPKTSVVSDSQEFEYPKTGPCKRKRPPKKRFVGRGVKMASYHQITLTQMTDELEFENLSENEPEDGIADDEQPAIESQVW